MATLIIFGNIIHLRIFISNTRCMEVPPPLIDVDQINETNITSRQNSSVKDTRKTFCMEMSLCFDILISCFLTVL